MTVDPTYIRPLVVIESPYMGRPPAWVPRWLRWPFAVWLRRRNMLYAVACMRDSLRRDEAPYASHLLYAGSGVLDDSRNAQRAAGLYCGFAWGARAVLRAVYCDHGVSEGMRIGITQRPRGQLVEYRYIKTPVWQIPTCEYCGEAAPPGANRCGGSKCRANTANY